MKKRVLISVLAVLPFFFSAAAMACQYCDNQYNEGHNRRYSDNTSATAQAFHQKRAELNRLYDEGVAESDEKAAALVSELDTLSEKMRTELQQKRNQSYRYRNYDDNQSYYRHGGCR